MGRNDFESGVSIVGTLGLVQVSAGGEELPLSLIDCLLLACDPSESKIMPRFVPSHVPHLRDSTTTG